MALSRRRAFSSRPYLVGIVVVVAAVVAGGLWYWYGSRDAGDVADGEGTVGDTTAVLDTAGREDLPELDASDELVRRLAEGLSSRPDLAEWLATDGLIRRFVGATVLVAAGRSPREEVEFLGPEGDFRAEPTGETVDLDTVAAPVSVVDTASYHRYDAVAATVASLETEGTAELYGRLRPLFQDAYRELGFRDRSFHVVLARAVETLLAVPVPEEPVEVLPTGGTAFEYRDPRLEALSPAQKHLLRMGPDNIRRVQAKLRELAEALDLPMLTGASSSSG
ncbi:MAG: DUF3014 domain-containing protein [Gemmatimonadota bacterium]